MGMRKITDLTRGGVTEAPWNFQDMQRPPLSPTASINCLAEDKQTNCHYNSSNSPVYTIAKQSHASGLKLESLGMCVEE